MLLCPFLSHISTVFRVSVFGCCFFSHFVLSPAEIGSNSRLVVRGWVRVAKLKVDRDLDPIILITLTCPLHALLYPGLCELYLVTFKSASGRRAEGLPESSCQTKQGFTWTQGIPYGWLGSTHMLRLDVLFVTLINSWLGISNPIFILEEHSFLPLPPF